jgi:threonine dehydratase
MNSNDALCAANSPLNKISVNSTNAIFLKEELRLTTNSYKIRGVTSFFRSSKNLPQSIEVLSAGNLALATAYECHKRGIDCTAIVPAGISELKKKNLLRLRARIEERPFDDIWNLVFRSDIRERDDFLHPLNPKIVSGYGDIYREIYEQLPDSDGLVIPYGVGGLALGIIRVLKAISGQIPVFVCEISGHDPLNRVLTSGDFVSGPKLRSFIEAMGTPEVIPDVFDEISEHIEGVITVTENEVTEGMRELFAKRGIRAEGAAGAAFASALKLEAQGKRNIVAVLTGGNICDDIFSEIIHG